MQNYLVLLRGINVGGNNIIKMADLKACFEQMGFTDVKTYIQSGNVLFASTQIDELKLTKKIETALSKQFDYKSVVVVVPYEKLKNIVENAPKGFGQQPDKYRYDVLFMKPPLTGVEALKSITLREGVDKVWAGQDVLYFSRLSARASQSYLSKFAGLPIYKFVTVRNWNTTTRLLSLANELL